MTCRNNSLTGADVKNLKSADVANGKLLAEDFAPGQLPRGEQGPPGIPPNQTLELSAISRHRRPPAELHRLRRPRPTHTRVGSHGSTPPRWRPDHPGARALPDTSPDPGHPVRAGIHRLRRDRPDRCRGLGRSDQFPAEGAGTHSYRSGLRVPRRFPTGSTTSSTRTPSRTSPGTLVLRRRRGLHARLGVQLYPPGHDRPRPPRGSPTWTWTPSMSASSFSAGRAARAAGRRGRQRAAGRVTTASYEARRWRLLRHAGRAGAPAVPGCRFLPPDFEAYRAPLQEVMAVLRGRSSASRSWASTRPTSTSPASTATAPPPGRQGGRQGETGLPARRHRAQQAGGEGRVRRREAGRLPRLTAEGARAFAGHSPGLIPGIGPKTVARLEAHGIATLGRLGATPDEQLARVVRPAARPPPRGARALRGRPRASRPADRQVRVARDDLRPRPARPGTARAGADRLTGELCETLARRSTAAARSASRCASTTSHGHPGAQHRRPGERLAHGRADRPRAAQAARPAPPRAAAGVRVAGLDESGAPAALGRPAEPVALTNL